MRLTVTDRPWLLLGALVVAWLGGCRSAGASSDGGRDASSAAEPDVPAVLARIGDEPVTLAEVRVNAGDQLDQLDGQYRRARSRILQQALAQVLRDRLVGMETARTGETAQQLIIAEAGGSLEPTDVGIAAWFQANQARAGGRSLEELKPQIAELLRNEHQRQAQEALESRLRKEHRVVVELQPLRFDISDSGAPALGPESAPVTLVEFMDFGCPYCARFAATARQLASEFGDQLRVVYRQFPIASLHPAAPKAAEASLCAQEQGKFWALHDSMFANQRKLEVTDLKALARLLGMDADRFDQCLDGGRYAEQVTTDMREGMSLGIGGTPAAFLNGSPVEGGAVSFEAAAEAVRAELGRQSQGRAPADGRK